MQMKGLILEDDQGREFLMGYERPSRQLEPLYAIRGWQRRRLVPVRYSDHELRQLIRDVLIALDNLSQCFLQIGTAETVARHPTEGGMQPLLGRPSDTDRVDEIVVEVLGHLKK